tara:strand:+ start:1059 stop:1415 length:357 start_codon:yes stop_codon:yes gene_type:complete
MDTHPDIEDYDEDEYDISDIIVESNDNEDVNVLMKKYKTKKKYYQTNALITKYEKTRVLSERASQINEGSLPLISHPEKYSNAYDIAVAEYNEKKIPFIIKRPYGNTYEYWRLADLIR